MKKRSNGLHLSWGRFCIFLRGLFSIFLLFIIPAATQIQTNLNCIVAMLRRRQISRVVCSGYILLSLLSQIELTLSLPLSEMVDFTHFILIIIIFIFLLRFPNRHHQYQVAALWVGLMLILQDLIYKILAQMQQHQQQMEGQDLLEENDLPVEEEELEEPDSEEEESAAPKRRRNNKRTTDKLEELEDDPDAHSEDSCDIYDDNFIIDRLPADKALLTQLLAQVKGKIKQYKQDFLRESQQIGAHSYVGENAVPICADITKFDFQLLISKQLEIAQREFDVLMMDPPWRLSSSQPSRGVAIQYSSLGDEAIENIPVPMLQREGFLFIWVINAKFQWTVNVMEKKWGYRVVDNINWVKKTVNGKIAKGHGFYLQHAKESCLVGVKGDFKKYSSSVASDVIFSERRGQSQKPTQIYEFIEKLVPNGYYLQIFGRRNNLRTNWVTIGNEI